ncbi:NUDIX domain-containing protein [Parvibaculum sp.]|uniref:NUDIX hydrolase n=1 Tax=Parvibaculum sp. TaxID=2024848 RepID=UPI0025DBCFCA|nr:NUDIX domain-containing protein [Parvibaculum sp.]
MSEIRTRPTARLLPFSPDGRLLLVRMHDPNVGGPEGHVLREAYWVTVGGAVDEGETLEEAARRELKEETGLDETTAKLGAPVWYTEHVLTVHGEKRLLQETFFLANAFTTDLTHQGLEDSEREVIETMRWWEPAALLASPDTVFPTSLRAHLPALLRGEVPGTVIHIDP